MYELYRSCQKLIRLIPAGCWSSPASGGILVIDQQPKSVIFLLLKNTNRKQKDSHYLQDIPRMIGLFQQLTKV